MKNNYEIRGDVTAIFTSCKGKQFEVLIDTNDFELANSFPNRWQMIDGHKGEKFYTWGRKVTDYNARRFSLHRLILGDMQEGNVVDHINGDTLDNRRCNLREVTPAQNVQNVKRARSNSKSGILGVHWVKRLNKWNATVRVNGTRYDLGMYTDIADAEMAVKIARAKHLTHADEYNDEALKKYEHAMDFTNVRTKNHSSGYKNVSYNKILRKWKVEFIKGDDRFYKLCPTLEEAKRLADEVRPRFHKVI